MNAGKVSIQLKLWIDFCFHAIRFNAKRFWIKNEPLCGGLDNAMLEIDQSENGEKSMQILHIDSM